MKRNAALLFVLLVFSKILGIIREMFLSFYYGAGVHTDAYLIASRIPNVIFGFVAAGLVSTFIPIYSKISQKEGEERADKYLDNVLTLVFITSLILVGLGLLFTEQLVKINALGFEGEALEISMIYVRITLFAMLANGVVNIFSGYQQYNGRFYVGPIGGFVMNITVILSIIISAKTGPIVMVYGLVVASVFQLIATYLIAIFKGGYRYKPTINLKDEYLKPMVVMALPIIFGSSINQINSVIDSAFASTVQTGAISILNYSSRISASIYSLFVASLTTVMYPTIIKQAGNNDFEGLKYTIIETMNMIALIVIPATVGLIVLSVPVVQIFYGRGALGDDALSLTLTASTLAFSSLGLIGVSIKDVLVRAFYSLHDSLTPVISGVIAVVINIVLNFLLAPKLGISGLALATSISALVGMVILFVSLNKKINGIISKEMFATSTKVIISSIAMGAVVYFSYQFLTLIKIYYLIALVISIILGVTTYVVFIYILKVEEFHDLLTIIKRKLKIGRK